VTQQQIDAILKSMPYECTHCDKKFATEGQFKKHLKRHEEMRFICGFPNCGKTFAFRKEMQIHLHQCHKYQTEEDQEKENVGYSCPVCAASAHSSHHSQQQESQEESNGEQHLDNVQKQHTFASLELLQHHLREAHAREDEPMFRCPYDGCLKVYTRQSNLNTHIRTSHGDEEEKFKFHCTFCHRRFCHKRSLNQHVQQEHSYEEESQLKKRQRNEYEQGHVQTEEQAVSGDDEQQQQEFSGSSAKRRKTRKPTSGNLTSEGLISTLLGHDYLL